MQAHVLANLLNDKKPAFPFLCLTVSGGHTQIVVCESPTQMKVIGETIDDAAGEAFDKSAKLLGLPYPGGPFIDKYAKQGDPLRFHFPEPQIPGLDFSFSGLKTAVLYHIREHEEYAPEIATREAALARGERKFEQLLPLCHPQTLQSRSAAAIPFCGR